MKNIEKIQQILEKLGYLTELDSNIRLRGNCWDVKKLAELGIENNNFTRLSSGVGNIIETSNGELFGLTPLWGLNVILELSKKELGYVISLDELRNKYGMEIYENLENEFNEDGETLIKFEYNKFLDFVEYLKENYQYK